MRALQDPGRIGKTKALSEICPSTVDSKAVERRYEDSNFKKDVAAIECRRLGVISTSPWRGVLKPRGICGAPGIQDRCGPEVSQLNDLVFFDIPEPLLTKLAEQHSLPQRVQKETPIFRNLFPSVLASISRIPTTLKL